MLYINPDECVDCGACEQACPMEAIYYPDDLREAPRPYQDENARLFTDTLPGQRTPSARRARPAWSDRHGRHFAGGRAATAR